MTEIRFLGPEYDGADEELHELADKLVTITDDTAVGRFGENALSNPTGIEVLPVVIDEPVFVVNAWHETASSKHPGRIQVHDFTLRTSLEGENAYLVTEDQKKYPITTRETLVLRGLSNVAITNMLLGSEPLQ